jgi:chromosome segregation ATPase
MITHTSTKRAISLLKNALREWDAKIKSLEEQLEQRDLMVAALEADTDEGRKETIGRLEKKIVRARDRITALETVLANTRDDLAVATRGLKDRADVILRLREQEKENGRRLADAEQSARERGPELARLARSLDRRLLVISQLEAQITDLRDALHASRRREQRNIESLAAAQNLAARQKMEIDGLDTRLQQSEEQVSTLLSDIENQRAHIRDLEKALQERDRQTEMAQSDRRETEDRANSLQAELARKSEYLDSLEKELANWQRKHAALETQVSDRQRQIEDLTRRLEDSTSEVGAVRAEFEDLKQSNRVTSIEERLVVSRLETALKDAQQKAHEFETIVGAERAQVRELERDISNKELELGAVNERLEQNERELRHFRERIEQTDQLEDDFTKRGRELEELRNEVNTQRRANVALKQGVDSLRQYKSFAEEKLDLLKSRIR